MAKDILMPALSPSMTEGTVNEWLKKEGDTVKSGDVLGTVQTDKTTMDLEAYDSGVLLKILVPAGTTVPINARIGVIGKKGETYDGSASAPTAPAAPAAKTEPEKAAPATPEPAPAAPAPAPAEQSVATESTGRIKASPLAKKVAAEHSVDLATLEGTGPGGRIVKKDVLAAPATPAPTATSAAKPAAAPAGDQKVKLTPMRAMIAKRLLESKITIPHFYLQIEVDAKPQVDFRNLLNDALSKQTPPVKLSFNDLAIKAAIEAIRRVPAVNASFEGDSIRMFGDINLSFAVAVDDGLFTPVIRQSQTKSLVQVSGEAKALAEKARSGKLKPEDYQGGTFTLSNLGSFGIDSFSAIINPPQAGILAVGNIVKKPVVDDKDQIVIGYRQSFTLSCDHRVIDGAVAANFMKAFREVIEKPTLLLL